MADTRLSPHYPVHPPLSEVFHTIPPGSDEYPLEKFAIEIETLLKRMGQITPEGESFNLPRSTHLSMIKSILLTSIP